MSMGGPRFVLLEESSLAVPRHMNPHWASGGPHDSTSTSTSQQASPKREKTNKPKSLHSFSFSAPARREIRSGDFLCYFPTRTSEAGESHGWRYTVGSRTHARPGPSGTGTFEPGPLVRTHVVFLFSLAKGYIGAREGQGVGRVGRFGASVPHWDKFTRPGRGPLEGGGFP